MSEHPERRDGFVHPSVKYEPTDLSLRAVLTFSGVLVAVLLGVSVGLYYMIPAMLGPTAEHPKPLSPWGFAPEPGPEADASHLPAKPELEAVDRAPSQGGGTQTRPIREQIKAEEERLNSYGETDEKGIVHIPIEEAMKRMAAGDLGGKP